jgi:hypothetical protein
VGKIINVEWMKILVDVNRTLGFIKGAEFLEQLSDYQVLKRTLLPEI